VPEPTWFIEGQLSLFYEEFGCGSPFGNCSVAAADSATIEHDGSFTPTELAWCITTAGLRYPCIKYNERNNELVVDLTVYTDYGPLGSWTHSYSLTEKNTERASLSVLLWDAHFEPPDVDVDGFHYGANFDHDKEMFRQTHLTVRP
jgi:hypothetical protein